MFKIIEAEDKFQWNNLVKSFENWDIYYLNEYAYSFSIHGDGRPFLLYYEDENCKMCDVIMKQDIHNFDELSNIPKNQLFDCITPYGYGGLLCSGNVTKESYNIFYHNVKKFADDQKIVSQFIRFHPLIGNGVDLSDNIKILNLKQTIFVDTTSKDGIFNNMDKKNRNMIRKAQKNQVDIIYDKGEHLSEFIKIYNSTMNNNHADKSYYFSKEYYEYIINEMKENLIFFYAVYENKIISASIFFYNDKYIHYHLSGTLEEYKHLGATNLLLYKVALWANEHHIEAFHLGGGVSSKDSLFDFKKKFNKNGYLEFKIGRIIFNQEQYDFLIQRRIEKDKKFDKNNNFLIQYRK